MNRYRVLLPLGVSPIGSGVTYTQGEEFEYELSEEDEAINVASGLLAIVPRRYRNIGESIVYDTPPGETFERALPLGNEAQLLAGGNIERLDDEPEAERAAPTPPKPTAKRASKSTAKPAKE